MKRWKAYISRRDIVLIAVALGCALAFAAFFYLARANGGSVRITVNGDTYGTFSLNEDRTVEIPNASGDVTNVLTIEGGEAWMSSAKCPDHTCMHEGRIRTNGASIVCLPNRVVVTVEGGAESDLDSVVN